MGQKVSPKGFRLIMRKKWSSFWHAPKKDFPFLLEEDRRIKKYLMGLSFSRFISEVQIRRMGDKIEVVIRTSRPGFIIGRKGVEIERLRESLSKIIHGKSVWVEVEEVKTPDLEAELVVRWLASQIERGPGGGSGYRRSMRKAIQSAKESGAKGIRIELSGRLGGAEMARKEWLRDGNVPLHTLKADISFAKGEAHTTFGVVGVKVWINLGAMCTEKELRSSLKAG